jgi:hypothetical protein
MRVIGGESRGREDGETGGRGDEVKTRGKEIVGRR